jgi:hypothetical protein
VLMPGAPGAFYTVNAAAPVHVRHDVHVTGDPAGPRPLVKVESSSAANFSFETDAANSTLTKVAFETSGIYPVTALARISVSDISVKGRSACLYLQGADSSLVDSSFDQTLASGVSNAACLTAFANGVQIRNVDLTSAKEPGPPGGYDTAVVLQGGGIQVDGLRVRSETGAIRTGGDPANPVVLRRVDVRGTGFGLSLSRGVVVTDSLVQVSGDNTRAVSASGGVLRNVAAIATGANSHGLHITATYTPASVTTDVRNSILRGDGKDIFMEPESPAIGYPGCEVITPGCFYVPPGPPGTLVIGNSNYRTSEVSSGATLTDAGGNSAADPLFVNPGAGDFHVSPGSPAIDAGIDDAQNGPVDLDGRPRKLGAAPDMGAYEFEPPAPPVIPADTSAPLVTGFDATNEVFAVGRAATPVNARARRRKRGTTFVFSSSEPGRATLSFSRARPGRRRGKRCVKPTRKNRRAKRCTRYVAIRPALTRTVAAGPTAVPFSGRIGTKALRPGRYRARLVVTDAAGNRSTPRLVKFRIVRP